MGCLVNYWGIKTKVFDTEEEAQYFIDFDAPYLWIPRKDCKISNTKK